MIVRAVIVGILIVAFTAPVFADPKSRGVDRREHRQKERIRQGLKSGELNREEVKGLMGEQREIRAKEREMKSDGTFTREERKELHQDLNEASQNIHEQKHDEQTR
jgi:uncharacterized protein (DUF3084 family)